MTRNVSTSTRGCPEVASTVRASEWVPAASALVKMTVPVLRAAVFVLTVSAAPPSVATVADPRLVSVVVTQATWEPVNENVAVLAAAVANLTDPP